MGKKGGASWLTAVKRALTTKTTKQDDDKKRERRRWLFRKSSNNVNEQKTSSHHHQDSVELGGHEKEEEHGVAMAAATVKAVSAAVTVHEAADVIRRTTAATRPAPYLLKHHFAAIAIQTTFRGYLARRALGAMKGIVMLQAVIRGQNVRKQATITLKCMQALVRVQSRLHHQRSRLSHDGGGGGGLRKPIIPETANSCDSKCFQDIRHRKSMSRDGSCIPDDWSEVPHTLGELDAILKSRKEANLSRETSLASAFSQQIWRSSRNPSTVDEKELEERANWLDRWIEAKQWESQRGSRASFDRRDSIKTVEIDSSRSDSRSATSVYKSQGYASHYVPNSPSRRSSYSPSVARPVTPSPIRTRTLQVRSASPRCMRDDRTYENAHIQSLRSTPRVNGSMCHYTTCANDVAMPNYMAATESAKARVRSQSTPRQRPSTPERDRAGSAKKRLAYPGPDPSENGSRGYSHNHLRSPSFKSVQVGHVGMGGYADSTGGEISPCSTTDLRRWLG